MTGQAVAGTPAHLADTQASAARARAIVMEVERGLGFDPTDREFEKLGYDIESRVPGTGKLRFIEVKGRVSGAADHHRDQERDPLLAQQARRLHPRHRRVPGRGRAPGPLLAPALPARAGLRGDERELRLRRADRARGAASRKPEATMLTKLTIRNFKVFDDVELELGDRVVLIGPNNAGKTIGLAGAWPSGISG